MLGLDEIYDGLLLYICMWHCVHCGDWLLALWDISHFLIHGAFGLCGFWRLLWVVLLYHAVENVSHILLGHNT